MSCHERQAFLAGDYKILRRVSDLPAAIQRLYTVKGESRIAMADPGQKFESTDVIEDPALPRRRLILAGVAQGRAFLHYEEGGIVHSYVLELFRLEPPETAVGVWRGFYGQHQNLDDMQQDVSKSGCK
jgi:hypothetical protein